MDPNHLRRDIIDEIGPDAYSTFDEQRYALPELFLRILADVVIIAFLKGFFDFESLGKGVRSRVEAFLKTFRDTPYLTTLDIHSDVDNALSKAQVPSEKDADKARQGLVAALITYGMHEDIARAHANEIERSITCALAARAGGAAANGPEL